MEKIQYGAVFSAAVTSTRNPEVVANCYEAGNKYQSPTTSPMKTNLLKTSEKYKVDFFKCRLRKKTTVPSVVFSTRETGIKVRNVCEWNKLAAVSHRQVWVRFHSLSLSISLSISCCLAFAPFLPFKPLRLICVFWFKLIWLYDILETDLLEVLRILGHLPKYVRKL